MSSPPPGTPGVVRGSCHHDCPDTCVWEVTVEDGRAVRLRGVDDHPLTRGQLCPKVNRFLDRVYHPDRLLRPLRRVGPKGSGRFEPTTWDDAIDAVVAALERSRAATGGEGILPFSFDGTQGVLQKGVVADRFFGALGASDVHRDLCGVTAWLGAADVTGVPLGIDPEDLALSDVIVLWGTNTHHTNRHLWPVIESARARGAELIVVDPIRTTTADRADVHLALRPGSDAALVAGVVHVLDRDGLLDARWLSEATSGWEACRASAAACDPAWTAAATGLDEEQIVRYAHRLAGDRVAIRTLVGPEHQRQGREIMRAISMVPAITGAWRHRGGGLARSTQVWFEEALAYPERRIDRRTVNMARLGEVLLDDTLDPPIDVLFVHNSNPAVILPDQERVVAGLGREDLFTVVVEQFLTDTARYADIVLPATTQVEHLDLGIAWGHLHLSLNRPAIEPVGESRSNTSVFRELAARLGLDDPWLCETDEALIDRLLDTAHPWVAGIDRELLRRRGWHRLDVPDGFRPNVDRAPATADGRFRLWPLEHRPVTAPVEFPLRLLTRKQHVGFLNANYGPFPEHQPRVGEPVMSIHPHDADARGLTDGDGVEVGNGRGRLRLVVERTDSVAVGTVTIPFGWWQRPGTGDADAGDPTTWRSVNVLTNAAVGDDDRGSAAFHDTFVEVTAVRP